MIGILISCVLKSGYCLKKIFVFWLAEYVISWETFKTIFAYIEVRIYRLGNHEHVHIWFLRICALYGRVRVASQKNELRPKTENYMEELFPAEQWRRDSSQKMNVSQQKSYLALV